MTGLARRFVLTPRAKETSLLAPTRIVRIERWTRLCGTTFRGEKHRPWPVGRGWICLRCSHYERGERDPRFR